MPAKSRAPAANSNNSPFATLNRHAECGSKQFLQHVPKRAALGQGTESVLRLRDKPVRRTEWNKHLNTSTEPSWMGPSIQSAPNALPPSPTKSTRRISLPLRIPMIVYFRSLAKSSDIASPHFERSIRPQKDPKLDREICGRVFRGARICIESKWRSGHESHFVPTSSQ